MTEPVEITNTDPILTKEIGNYGGSSRNGSGAGLSVVGSPSRTAEETIRQVLGWRYRGQDTKGFLAALNRAFDLKEVEGHTEWAWKPQNYMVQADLGEITGAQASILTRAKVIVEHALPLLDGLTPLREDADEDEMEAVRSIIRNALNELLREFAAARGPRVQRVEGYFDQVLGDNPDPRNPEIVGGYLGILRERFGLNRVRVNTIAEEQNLTNFIVLVDYVFTLYQTWDSNLKYFDRVAKNAEPFLGTQLVLLSQIFETIAESVREAYDAMDSVFFSAIERQTTNIPFVDKDGKPLKDENNQQLFDEEPSPLTIAELLGWVEDFAIAEARLLIQDAGKDGVVAARQTLRQLRRLIKAVRIKSEETNNLNPIRGFQTRRVQQALRELEAQLTTAYDLTAEVRPAELSEILPEQIIVSFDGIKSITLIGDNLSQEGKVFIIGSKNKIEARSSNALDDQKRSALFDLDNDKFESGKWDVEFLPETGSSVKLNKVLDIVVFPPSINNVSHSGNAGGDISLTITGDYFRKGANVTLKQLSASGGEIKTKRDAEVKSGGTEIIAEFENVIAGNYVAVVINPDGQRIQSDEFEIIQVDQPKIQSIEPKHHEPAQNVKITISGRNFDVERVTLKNGDITIDGQILQKATSTQVKANFNLGNQQPGDWTLMVINKDTNESNTLNFVIDHEKLDISKLYHHDPLEPGNTMTITITGKGFQKGSTVTIADGVKVSKPQFINANMLKVDIDIDNHAALGKRKLTVKNPDNQIDEKDTLFVVK